jgi:hypothetical protein
VLAARDVVTNLSGPLTEGANEMALWLTERIAIDIHPDYPHHREDERAIHLKLVPGL